MAIESTRADPKAENRYLWRRTRLEVVASLGHDLIRWTGAVLIAYFGYRTVSVLAGGTTAANIGIRFLADVRVSEAVAWLFGVSGVLMAFRERQLRRATVERMHGRIKTLEEQLDPGRSSSQLTPRGETNPEDRL
jgi:hypothetical protein